MGPPSVAARPRLASETDGIVEAPFFARLISSVRAISLSRERGLRASSSLTSCSKRCVSHTQNAKATYRRLWYQLTVLLHCGRRASRRFRLPLDCAAFRQEETTSKRFRCGASGNRFPHLSPANSRDKWHHQRLRLPSHR